MQETWRRSEPRDVRPFFGADPSDALKAAAIRLFDGDSPSQSTSFRVEEVDFIRLQATLFPNVSLSEAWIPDTYSLRDFDLVCLAGNSFLKQVVVTQRFNLEAGVPDEIVIDRDLIA